MLPRLDARAGRFPGAVEALAMAGIGGAAALGLARETGRIASGRLADIVLLRLGDAATASALPSAETVLRHGSPAHVEATMVGGAWAFRDGRVLAFDEAAALRDFAAHAQDLVARAAAGRRAARTAATLLAPALEAYCGRAG
jgi:5-methylthioadenosine/S-adenosylhomocysteine deaminase